MAISSANTGLRAGVCTSTTRPTNPYIGQIIFQTDTGTMHNWDGAAWQFLAPTQQRNLLYNGAMQVAQRGTSTPSITASGYYTSDRWRTAASSLGTWTQAIVSTTDDYPAGSGFRQSLKMTCTTSNASPAAGAFILVQQFLEGQDLQSIRKGTSSAQQITMSFWVRSGTTGTYIAELLDNDNTRQCSKAYTISAANTWEFKTIVFPADTTGVLDNDNQASLFVNWWLGAGSSFTSGTLNTSWAASTSANRVVGQVNLASATNNYWQVTGVQLNVGSVAAPFEFKSFGQELQSCQRYYEVSNGIVQVTAGSTGFGGNTYWSWMPYNVEKRIALNYSTNTSANGLTIKDNAGVPNQLTYWKSATQYTATNIGFEVYTNKGHAFVFNGGQTDAGLARYSWAANAEL